jgi:hypothetical protein
LSFGLRDYNDRISEKKLGGNSSWCQFANR